MNFGKKIRPSVDYELRQASSTKNQKSAFQHLERAHVLGQASTREHVRVHWEMLRWGIRQGDRKEIIGQLFRIIGALTKTAIGLVPTGNTGGSNISPFKKLPIPAELQAHIDRAKQPQ